MQEIDIRMLFFALLKNIKWLILAGVIGAILAGAYTVLMVEDTYTSQTKLYVNNYTDMSGVAGLSSGSIQASQEMVKECMAVVRDDYVMDEVRLHLADSGYALTNKQISSMLTLAQQSDTAVLIVRATTTDPKMSRAICQAVYDVAPGRLLEIIQLGSIKPMAPPMDGSFDGSYLPRNVAIGLLIGVLLAAAIVLIVLLTDTTVKDEKDLKKHFDVVVLGVIPTFQEAGKSRRKRTSRSRHVEKDEQKEAQ